MQRGMLRMPAILEKRFRRFPLGADLHQAGRGGVDFTEMRTETALTIMNLEHEIGPPVLKIQPPRTPFLN
jgi:hypothetical protein